MIKLAKRVLGIEESATLNITSKAKKMVREGIDVVSFAAGEPDFDTPAHIKTAAIKAINEGFTKYTPSSGTIAIKISGTDKEMRFEISDTGPGIAREDIDKLFNKFERIFAERQEGTGLGLSIARDIVELHKGKIWVESEIGKGSKFIFILPRDFKASSPK